MTQLIIPECNLISQISLHNSIWAFFYPKIIEFFWWFFCKFLAKLHEASSRDDPGLLRVTICSGGSSDPPPPSSSVHHSSAVSLISLNVLANSPSLSNSAAEKYCPNILAMYWSLLPGQTPSRNAMCPPRAVTTIATCDDFSAALIGIAEEWKFMSNVAKEWKNYDLKTKNFNSPSNGWNGSSAADKHNVGTLILWSLLWSVACL